MTLGHQGVMKGITAALGQCRVRRFGVGLVAGVTTFGLLGLLLVMFGYVWLRGSPYDTIFSTSEIQVPPTRTLFSQ